MHSLSIRMILGVLAACAGILALAACAGVSQRADMTTANTDAAHHRTAPVTVAGNGPIAARPGAAMPGPNMAAITTRIDGLPAALPAGGKPVDFTAVLANHSGISYSDVAPLFTIVGGECNCVTATLQRLDPATGKWQTVRMPEGDGENPLLAASGGISLPRGATVTIGFRLTVAADSPAEKTVSMLNAVVLPSRTPIGWVTIADRVTRSQERS